MYYFLEINSILIQFKFAFIAETRNKKVIKSTLKTKKKDPENIKQAIKVIQNKMKMYWNFTHPLEILDDTEWNMSLHDLPTKWSSAVNGCRQNESKQLIKNTSLETKKERNKSVAYRQNMSPLFLILLSWVKK